MKELKFICVQPDDTYYTWQVHLWIESLKKLGYSDKAIVLIFTPHFRNKSEKWQKVIDLYPETEFVFYKDENNEISSKIGTYIPILRPWTLMKYFSDHPEMKEKAVFYCDSDILLTDKLNIDQYINDDVNYVSDTKSYIGVDYFDSKKKDVLSTKLNDYKKRDILSEIASMIGISRELAKEKDLGAGGAQYLLKNIDGDFWKTMIDDCMKIRIYLQTINKEFFKDENAGFQSWCADMWALLWGLWKRGADTKIVPEMEFAWSSDSIEKLKNVTILHNAGIVSDDMGYPAFYKGKYHLGADPLKDPHIVEVYGSDVSKKYCTHYYLSKLIELKQKYNLNY